MSILPIFHRKSNPPLRVIEIPKEHLMEVCERLDALENDHGEARNQRTVSLWTLIEKLVPETKEGEWELRIGQTRGFMFELKRGSRSAPDAAREEPNA